MITQKAAPLKYWINVMHEGNITHAAKALGVDRSTLHRVMNSAYVINGVLYTTARASK
jgi:transcriptional regulator of acetoin/glycerol metabolism